MITLLITESEVKDLTPVSRNITITSPLLPSIREAQEAWIRPILGDCKNNNFYQDVIDKVAASLDDISPVPLTQAYIDLLAVIKPALAWYTIYEMQKYNYIHIREAGAVQSNGTTYTQIDISAHKYQQQMLLDSANRCAIQIVKFLDDNANDYPLWLYTTYIGPFAWFWDCADLSSCNFRNRGKLLPPGYNNLFMSV